MQQKKTQSYNNLGPFFKPSMETSFSRINLYLGLVQETCRKPCEVSNHLEEQAQLSFLKDLIPNRTLQNYSS